MTIHRISPRGLNFNIMELSDTEVEIRLVGTTKKITVNAKLEQLSAAWYQWQMKRAFVQDAFHFLKPSEREFLLTGIDANEWNKIFGPDSSANNDKEYQDYLKSVTDPRD